MSRYPISGRPDLALCERIDRGVIPLIRRMHANGIAIDRDYFYELSDYLKQEMREVEREILEYVPLARLYGFLQESLPREDAEDTGEVEDPVQSFNVDSPDQIAELLFKHLGIGRTKKLATTKSGKRLSTGKKQMDNLKDDHPVVGLILKRRELAKLDSTYASKLPRIARYDPKTGQYRVYTTFGITFTSTGRFNSKGDYNAQNIPIRSELGALIRYGFIPSPGKVFLSLDFSQIELRVLAHCAKEQRMIDIFKNNGDIHISTACSAFGIDPAKFDKKIHNAERQTAKILNFGITFSMTSLGLQQALQLAGIHRTEEQCEDFIQAWFAAYPDVKTFQEAQAYQAKRYGFVWTLWGFVRLVPEVRSVHKRIVAAGLRQAGNVKVQGSAASILKIAGADVHDFMEEVRLGAFGRPHFIEPNITVHDQFVLEADPEIAQDCGLAIQSLMEDCVELDVPLKADWGIQDRWEK